MDTLRVSENGRYLIDTVGRPVFLLADAAFWLVRRLRRADVAMYLRTRRTQGFNAVALVAVGSDGDFSDGASNAYDHPAFAVVHGRPDPTRPLVTPGHAPAVAGAYAFWDHLDYCVDQCATEGLYVLLLPTWGSWVVGSYDGRDTTAVLFDADSAYVYGRFLGDRYRHRRHVLWMLGGNRAAVNGPRDARPVFRAMARGIAEGVHAAWEAGGTVEDRTPLMSYHPRKGAPPSSAWFHEDTWLRFNAIQEWPEHHVAWITTDWERLPVKPTWVCEGRFENFHRQGYRPEQYLDRIPDQRLIDGEEGRVARLASDRLTATRGSRGDYAMVYSANGRRIRLRMERLAASRWPRSGSTHATGGGTQRGTSTPGPRRSAGMCPAARARRHRSAPHPARVGPVMIGC